MPSLISNGLWEQINSALRDVTDTFMRAPMTYKKWRYEHAGGSLDRWNEDRKDIDYDDYSLEALIEYPDTSSGDIKILEGGAVSPDDIKVTFNLDYLGENGLLDINNMAIFVAEADYMIVNNQKYKVTQVLHDGQLKNKYVLVVVKGKKDTN